MAAAFADASVRPTSGASQAGASRGRGGLAAYMFLAPWLLGFFGLTLGPALGSLYLSFTDFDLLRDPNWIGG